MSLDRWIAGLLFAAFLSFIVGCGGNSSSPTAGSPSPEGTAYKLAEEPGGVLGVHDAREESKDDEQIAVVGRIGGDANPWVEGQAAFLIVDPSMQPCKADEGCPTPWDYCCDADQLAENKAMVKVVDASGKTVATDARKLLGLKELQTVVVRGRAKRDEAGNLTVLAEGVFVRN
jgi:hypothetical protein